jgi:hypothetical protein
MSFRAGQRGCWLHASHAGLRLADDVNPSSFAEAHAPGFDVYQAYVSGIERNFVDHAKNP